MPFVIVAHVHYSHRSKCALVISPKRVLLRRLQIRSEHRLDPRSLFGISKSFRGALSVFAQRVAPAIKEVRAFFDSAVMPGWLRANIERHTRTTHPGRSFKPQPLSLPSVEKLPLLFHYVSFAIGETNNPRLKKLMRTNFIGKPTFLTDDQIKDLTTERS